MKKCSSFIAHTIGEIEHVESVADNAGNDEAFLSVEPDSYIQIDS